MELELVLAELLDRPGGGTAARERLEALTKQAPERPEPLEALGDLALREGRRDEAKRLFGEAFSRGGRGERLLWNYGRLTGTEDAATAMTVLGLLLKQRPDRTDVRMELALAQVRAEQATAALKTLGEAKAVGAKDAARYFSVLAYAAYRAGDPEEARKAARRMAEVAKTPEEKQEAERLLNHKSGRPALAVAAVEEAEDEGAPRTTRATPPAEAPESKVAARPSVEGRFVELQCVGQLGRIVLETADGRKVFAIDTPDKIEVLGAATGFAELNCGKQKPVPVRIEYEPPNPSRSGIDGLLRLIQFGPQPEGSAAAKP